MAHHGSGRLPKIHTVASSGFARSTSSQQRGTRSALVRTDTLFLTQTLRPGQEQLLYVCVRHTYRARKHTARPSRSPGGEVKSAVRVLTGGVYTHLRAPSANAYRLPQRMSRTTWAGDVKGLVSVSTRQSGRTPRARIIKIACDACETQPRLTESGRGLLARCPVGTTANLSADKLN